MKEKINEFLSQAAEESLETRGCKYFWGETEIPECLRKEIEKKQEDEA